MQDMKKINKKNERKTHEIDASGQVMGRLATRVATLLRGKHKPTFEPHLDEGDKVIIKNIAQIVLSGKKEQQKKYHHYSGYPGGLKTKSYMALIEKKPQEAFRKAVYNMLDSNRLRKGMMKRLIIE